MVRTYQKSREDKVGQNSSWSAEKRGEMLGDDTVTLTKSQLRAILEAVGTAQGLTKTDDFATEKPIGNDDSRFADAKFVYHDDSPTTERHFSNMRTFENVTKTRGNTFHEGASKFSDNNHQLLSKIEIKKRQWEKEKAEESNWSPWGRPGGGAPRRISSDTPTNPPREPRKSLQFENGTSGLPSPELPLNLAGRGYSGCSSVSNSMGRHVPEFLRSSLPFGPNSMDVREDEEQKKRIWQEELKHQREEQRHRKDEMGRWYSDDNPDYLESQYNQPYSNAVSPLSSVATTHTRSYHRGQGVLLDADQLSKLEEKRQKASEYQQVIQAQVDEKKRRECEEKARQKMEEEKEERRLQEERDRLREQYEEEQRKIKEKQEEKERKQQVLLSAIQEAQASAEKAKMAKRRAQPAPAQAEPVRSRPATRMPRSVSRNLESRNSELSELENKISGNEVDLLPSAVDSQRDTERWVASSLQSEPLSEKAAKPQQTVYPVQNGERVPLSVSAPLPQPSNRESAVQTVRPVSAAVEEKSPYIQNRLLTPSQWRLKERNSRRLNVWGKSREFGTQTEVDSVNIWPADDGETASSSSSVSSSSPQRLPRVQHSKPTKASRNALSSQNSEAEKPKWGANKPDKTFVKMTDRDPHYYKRKKMQELRKQHWEREMATQRTLTDARRSVLSSRNQDRVPPSRSGVPWRSESSVLNAPILSSTFTIAPDSRASFAHGTPVLHKRFSLSTDNIQAGKSAPSMMGAALEQEVLPPIRRKWHSQETFFPSVLASTSASSPPPPSRNKKKTPDPESIPTPRRKWSDQDCFDLDHLAVLQALSRRGENSDGEREKSGASSQDPLVNPDVVKRRPTPRQDRILQQLSSLRQGLLQKQKEIDSWLTNRPPRTAS